ncbi:MAG: DmsC/YnfH family molybdoenzyme membrane anchor subunit [Candidatus Krumholzibacteriia bacterium]|nr:4Fe-4S dicluster domain-containing protein [bacterium]MCB9513123.1 4Fe-4S dicluster domain-containing protein [Candidatus Latescibacterota bacterium]MCB9514588.1 4Fe-4S dicluster domain-containing protein [Candidatus Latescibacterota bacterium]
MTMRAGFHLDLSRCTGCQACQLACGIENALPWGESWRRVETFNPGALAGAPRYHLSLACMHCADAPCAIACPADAYARDATTGALILDPARCIGCRYCSWACPYDAPRFDARAGTMSKCTLCQPRLAEGREPACVALCPTDALNLLDLDAPAAALHAREVPGFDASQVRPALRFTPLPPGADGPEGPPPGGGGAAPPGSGDGGGRRLSLRDEWPLLLFSTALPLLVAMRLDTLPPCRLDRPLPILWGGLAAMALSTAHLGKPWRAWRALLGIRHSWLSREIAATGAFVLLAGALPLLLAPNLLLSLAGGMAGFAALYAMDRLYEVADVPRGSVGVHSAEAVPNAIVYTLAFRGWAWPLAGALLLLALLWLGRYRGGARPVGWVGGLRAAALIAAGIAVAAGAAPAGLPVMGLMVVGALLDRAAFYRELRLPSPRRTLDRALATRLGPR